MDMQSILTPVEREPGPRGRAATGRTKELVDGFVKTRYRVAAVDWAAAGWANAASAATCIQYYLRSKPKSPVVCRKSGDKVYLSRSDIPPRAAAQT